MQRIEDAVNGGLEAMRQRRVSEYSLKCIRWSVYRRIVVWHHTHDTDICSYELLSSLCELQQSSTYDDYLFYTKRRGVCSQMSCDTAQTFIKKYGIMAQKLNSAIPHVHPHIYLGTPALCTCIWQVCRWSLFPNGSAILSWRHL